MFNIGDVVFYKVYGAGYILDIKKEDVYGSVYTFYIIKFINNIDMMIPINSEKLVNIRKGISSEECKTVFQILEDFPRELPKKWSERFRIYNNAIKSGDIFELSKVARDIAHLSQSRKLSKSDIKIFYDILSMVAGEISLVKKNEYNDTRVNIEKILDFKLEP